MHRLTWIGLLALAVTGCTSTQTVIREFDIDGKLVRETQTSESVVKSLMDSTRNKTVIAWESGWSAYLSCSSATIENPSPTFKMGAGKIDSGIISALPETSWAGLPEVIAATRQDFAVTVDGITQTDTQQ